MPSKPDALMTHAVNVPPHQTPTKPRASARAGKVVVKPFCGLIDPVIAEDPVAFVFPGSVSRAHAKAVWTWVVRDLCSDLISAEGVVNGNFGAADLEPLMAEILKRMKKGIEDAGADFETGRRLRAMLGSDEARDSLPTIMGGLRHRALLAKAQTFGRAINNMTDEAALSTAVQSMPLQDQAMAALLFHAAMGHIANPTRLVSTLIRRAGSANEETLARTGYTPILDAILAHAQNQIYLLQPNGAFADIDLTCRGLERFHRLVRSLTGYVEFSRNSRWTTILAGLTKLVSERIEPRLKDIVSDLNLAMRRGREGADRLDSDMLLAAINGIYLLSTIRDCRDSLALNAAFDQTWSQAGQALETHIQRNLDLLRQHPGDVPTNARLDAAIKMAEVRFNPEYAETLRRARAAAERRG